jgi:hypothetical protein
MYTWGGILRIYFPSVLRTAQGALPQELLAEELWNLTAVCVSDGAVARDFFTFFLVGGVRFVFMLPFVCESSAGFAGVSSVWSC